MPTLATNPHVMPASDYHAIEALSASGIKQLLRSPLHYRTWRDTPKQPTDAMKFGTVFHAALLEPHTLDSVCVALPEEVPDGRTTVGKEFRKQFAAQSVGRIVITHAQRVSIDAMVDSVAQHDTAYGLLSGPLLVEPTLLWQEPIIHDSLSRFPAKARLDALAKDFAFILDVKTTVDASKESFARTIWNYRYDIQAAWYLDAVTTTLDVMPHSYLWLAIESEPPYACALYRADRSILDRAAHDIRKATAQYVACIDSGTWRGYSEGIEPITLPRYAQIVKDY